MKGSSTRAAAAQPRQQQRWVLSRLLRSHWWLIIAVLVAGASEWLLRTSLQLRQRARQLRHLAGACTSVPIFSLPHRIGSVGFVDGGISADAFRAAGFDAGFGEPVTLRGAALISPAFQLWATDAAMLAAHGDEVLSHVETSKTETRELSARVVSTLRDFLANYNSSERYLVAIRPAGLGEDLALPPLLACERRAPYLSEYHVWMSSGADRT